MALSINNRERIPNHDIRYGPWAVKIYTDAAGRSKEYSCRRIGAVFSPHIWCQILHGTKTNEGILAGDGKSLAHKMSVWELVGPLLAITCALDKVHNKTALALVDNMGSVIW